MPNEQLEKLKQQKYVAEKKLTAAKHKEKRLQSELKRLTRSERTHRLCTRAGMLETFLKEPTVLTDEDVMELLTFIFQSEAVQKKLNLLIESRRKTQEADEGENVIRDSVGNVLTDGDTVTVTRNLKVKGSSGPIKAGTKVRNIRLVNGVGDHDIDCKVDGFGAMQLKSSVVKKA